MKLHVWFIDQLQADATGGEPKNAFEGPVSKVLFLLVQFHSVESTQPDPAYSLHSEQPSLHCQTAIGAHKRTSRSVHSDKSSEGAGPEKDLEMKVLFIFKLSRSGSLTQRYMQCANQIDAQIDARHIQIAC